MYSRVSVIVVSIYLFVVGVWLILTRQIAAAGLTKILFGSLRRRYRGELSNFRPEQGRCWLGDVPDFLLSDKEAASRLRLLEDGKPLGPAHAGHDDVRNLGSGRFSHWGTTVYFSTSDDSDPRSNGRRYTVSEEL
jgi:hypothetical protein